jgi:serine/threonine-protein kinase
MLTPGTIIAGYRIDRVLGEGGMGIVYEATQMALNRKVALKLLAPHLSRDDDLRERFRREGLAQAAIEHPNVVTIYEAGESEVGAFIAMRLVRGTTLGGVSPGEPLPPERALRLVGQVADALDAAHEGGFIHRDIKPQNILIDERDRAYLADFGLAKIATTSSLTHTGMFVGTLSYVAPEQIMGEPATPACDVYSLAAVLFECLTGQAPFRDRTRTALPYAHMTAPRPKASAARSELPPAIDDVLASGMAIAPQERPPTAGELLRRLRAALAAPGAAETPPAAQIPPTRVDSQPIAPDRAEPAAPEPTPDPPPPPPAAAPPPIEIDEPTPVPDPTPAPPPTEVDQPTPIPEPTPAPPTEIDEPTPIPEPPPAPEPAPPPPAAPEPPPPPPARPAPPPAPPLPAGADRIRIIPQAPPTPATARRRSRGVRIAVWAALVPLIVVGVVGAYIAGRPEEEPPSGGPSTLAAGSVRLAVPAGWRQVTPAPSLPGAELADPIAATTRGARAGNVLLVGRTSATGPTLLPGGLRQRLRQPEPGDPVRLNGLEALRYSNARGGAALYAAQTTAGVLLAACLGASGDRGWAARCERAAAGISVEDAETIPLSPDADYARALDRAFGGLNRARAAGRRRLAGAKTPGAQGRAAAGIANAYASARKQLRSVPTRPLDRDVHGRLLTALASARSSYAALASTARRKSGSGFAAARKDVSNAEHAVQRTVNALKRLGYEPKA